LTNPEKLLKKFYQNRRRKRAMALLKARRFVEDCKQHPLSLVSTAAKAASSTKTVLYLCNFSANAVTNFCRPHARWGAHAFFAWVGGIVATVWHKFLSNLLLRDLALRSVFCEEFHHLLPSKVFRDLLKVFGNGG